MKGIIFKLIFVFIFTVFVACSIGLVIVEVAKTPNFTYTINGVTQTDLNPTLLGLKMGIFSWVLLTSMLAWFYIQNISILIITYRETKAIENENIIYQRDLADDYNSAIASYIIDGIIETKQDYQAVIVELEDKGLIYKENGKYKVKEGNWDLKEKLLSNQKIVLNQIMERKINFRQFKNAVISDAIELGYVKLNKGLLLILVITAFMNPLAIFFILYLISKASTYMYTLTKQGKKEKDKIFKLKKYLINFSNLHELDKSDNNIWGEYLAYAISLNVNKKIKVKQINF